MKSTILKSVLVASTIIMASAVGAQAACTFPAGTIQNNDAVSFKGGITTSNTVFKRVFNSPPRTSGGEVKASAECKAVIFPGSGGHIGAQKGETKPYSADVRGIGCDCR